MDYIIYFLNNHHTFIEKQTDKDYIIMWNNRFFDLSDNTLFKIITASNYLDIECLFELACNEVANIIKRCYTPQNIRKRFNIKDDITPEEEKEIYKSFSTKFL
jgi:S-phase kinase-associated protein 1